MRAWIRIAVCCAVLPMALARAGGTKHPRPAAWGVPAAYSDIRLSGEDGDVGGMEVIILPAGGRYWATVTFASGEIHPPVLVPLTVKGEHLEFTVPRTGSRPPLGGSFKATVARNGLRIDDGVNKPRVLRRQWIPIYSDLYLEGETGDLGGMEVIFPAASRWATVVIASGDVYDPVLVELGPLGVGEAASHVQFTVPSTGPRPPPGGSFKGTVKRDGLLIDDGVNPPRLLRSQRRSQFAGDP